MAKKAQQSTTVETNESDIVCLPGLFGGETLYILEDGFYMPVNRVRYDGVPDPRINFPKIRNMNCQEDDVYLCAFPKSGTNWVWEICSMLVRGEAKYLPQMKVTNMLELHYPEEFDNVPSPRILNTHLPFRLMPSMVKQGTGKILFVQRNPKDVIVSAFHHRLYESEKDLVPSRENFDNYFQIFCTFGLSTSWFDYTNEWHETITTRKDLSVHIMYYEDLKKDLVRGITEISKFLGTNNDPSFIAKVAELCEFKNMKKVNHSVKIVKGMETRQKLMKHVYRKGEVGDWKNWFTVAQNEQFDALYAEKMKDCDFPFTYIL